MQDATVKDTVIELLKKSSKSRIRRRQLYKLSAIKGLDYEDFKRVLDDMEAAGTIVRLKGRRFSLPEASGIFTGVFTLARNGGGYIRSEDGVSYYVMPRNAKGALSGDTVRADISRKNRPGYSPTAKVLEIIERSSTPVIGIFRRTVAAEYIMPKDEKLSSMLVKNAEDFEVKEGDMVVVHIDMPQKGFSKPMCEIVEVLGDPDAPGVDVVAIARQYRLAIEFPEEVLDEVKGLFDDLGEEAFAGRRDNRDTVTFTIDPDDAKDFDDAISISKDDAGNFHLGVHIADVAHYVKDHSRCDREAQKRGMSCYLVDRVLPMLPERLSNDLCSLKPDVDRLTKSVFAVVSSRGDVLSSEIDNTVIHSDMRLTYKQVQTRLDGKTGNGAGDITPEVFEGLTLLSELADLLIKKREDRGTIDFVNPEAKIILDELGKPVDIIKYEQLKAHKMIEEAMILANVITARSLGETEAPFLYRIHDTPDKEKLAGFAETAKALGYSFKASRADDREYIRDFLRSISESNHERTLNMLMLRSMKRARYSISNSGHYGLALKHYTHFTSPIRRYPDLIVHRQLDNYVIHGKRSDNHERDYYDALGDAITQQEINTDNAERDSIKMKAAEFMNGHLGEEFEGTITGMVPSGFWVELDRYFVEGFVHVSNLHNDYYIIDDHGVALVGRSSGHRFMLGDRLKVQVAAADKDKAEIDFMVVAPLSKRKLRPNSNSNSKKKPNTKKKKKRR